MAVGPFLSERQLDALRRLDTCTVSNAIETFGTRLRNTGYAATARLRSGSPPMQGGSYQDRTD
ncbi:MAG TPA: hypothetical protein VG860_20030 [Terriglobia bacterium]|nr:hypothetical protein [Terriglobia bacterium]